MKSPCLQIANAILQTHRADIAELTSRSVGKDGIYSLRTNLHAREKKSHRQQYPCRIEHDYRPGVAIA
ncbi:hypothetical protein ACF3VQ_20800 [Yersinia sp. HM-2024]|uniref:hypothetical protein n=1 Tax=Yersinia sp. HM-2024 TaxID=3344550 RepID=UPI00370D707F